MAETADQPKAEDHLQKLISNSLNAREVAERLQPDASSVRTTFSLSREAIDTLDRLADRTGKTLKDLLREVLELSRFTWDDHTARFRQIADSLTIEEETRKSMAVHPETRKGLNDLANKSGISRNCLVEVGIRLAKLVTEEAIQKKIDPHEEILPDLNGLADHVEEVRAKFDPAEDNDPIDSALFGVLRKIENMIADIEQEVRSGAPMDEDHDFI